MTPQEIQIISIETIYALLIIIPSLMIYYKVNKIYEFSKYKGLKYFSIAFLFLAIGFFIRYFVILQNVFTGHAHQTIQTFNAPLILMEFFIILPSMFLLYSLIWKRFEKKKYSKKPINTPLLIIYTTSLAIAILDYVMQTLLFLYITQLILYGAATLIAYKKYKKEKQSHKQFYFITMTLFLIGTIINFIAQYTIDKYPFIRIYTYLITVIVVFLFLYITNKLLKRKK